MIGFRETTLEQLTVEHTIEVNILTGSARLTVPIKKLVSAVPAAVKEAAARMTVADVAVMGSATKTRGNVVTAVNPYDNFLNPKKKWVPGWGLSFVREVSPIFCVPGNDRMLKLWDRVSDRLYKLRHCQDSRSSTSRRLVAASLRSLSSISICSIRASIGVVPGLGSVN